MEHRRVGSWKVIRWTDRRPTAAPPTRSASRRPAAQPTAGRAECCSRRVPAPVGRAEPESLGRRVSQARRAARRLAPISLGRCQGGTARGRPASGCPGRVRPAWAACPGPARCAPARRAPARRGSGWAAPGHPGLGRLAEARSARARSPPTPGVLTVNRQAVGIGLGQARWAQPCRGRRQSPRADCSREPRPNRRRQSPLARRTGASRRRRSAVGRTPGPGGCPVRPAAQVCPAARVRLAALVAPALVLLDATVPWAAPANPAARVRSVVQGWLAVQGCLAAGMTASRPARLAGRTPEADRWAAPRHGAATGPMTAPGGTSRPETAPAPTLAGAPGSGFPVAARTGRRAAPRPAAHHPAAGPARSPNY